MKVGFDSVGNSKNIANTVRRSSWYYLPMTLNLFGLYFNMFHASSTLRHTFLISFLFLIIMRKLITAIAPAIPTSPAGRINGLMLFVLITPKG